MSERAATSILVPSRMRARSYAVALALTLVSVPFVHLYLRVDLTPAELLLHALDTAFGTLLGIVLFEGVISAWQRSLTWRFSGWRPMTGVALAAVALTIAVIGHAPHDVLPGMAHVRAKHVASGYGDMSLRVLPVVALILWLAVTAGRRAALRDELDALRALNAELLARSQSAESATPSRPEDGGEARAAPFTLRHDGDDLLVDPSRLLRVHAQENYCELVFDDRDDDARPLVRATMSEIEQRLPGAGFVRTHRSHLANLRGVTALRRTGRRAWLELSNGDEVPVARGRLGDVRAAVERLVAGEPAEPAEPA